jgi:Flp pilus assembly protein TadB
MIDNFANLPATVQIVLAVLLAVWLALLLLVPFMIESIRNSSRKTRAQLELLNQKMDRLIDILERGESAGRTVGPRAQHAERVRKEPTISG